MSTLSSDKPHKKPSPISPSVALTSLSDLSSPKNNPTFWNYHRKSTASATKPKKTLTELQESQLMGSMGKFIITETWGLRKKSSKRIKPLRSWSIEMKDFWRMKSKDKQLGLRFCPKTDPKSSPLSKCSPLEAQLSSAVDGRIMINLLFFSGW